MATQQIENVLIVVFDGFERLDVEGPLAVLSWLSTFNGGRPAIRIVSKDGKSAHDHLLKRDFCVNGCLGVETGTDLLIVPGGNPNLFICDTELVSEIARLTIASGIVASVCTGAFLVAKTGFANNRSMTTHWQFSDAFREMFPAVNLRPERRFVHDGNLWSSAGISAGIDMTLQLVADQWGIDMAERIQTILQYCPEPPFSCSELSPTSLPVPKC